VAGSATARLVARASRSALAAVGCVVAAGGLAALGRLSPDSPHWGSVLPGLALVPTGVAITFSSATASAADAEFAQAGVVAGLINTAIELGPALGLPALVAVASGRGTGW
jgi:hypothetical protein